ncbi:glycoside hydrolase family 76 protein [Sodiomyces alcalophilus JCM 7366]|uniref:glycoside hydrolase family 76 protein n=1 Tax=Sodiomyces alcalophilus JCM 7366 TaxID=591952 RepID=UPI0039B3A7AB
MRLLSVLGAFSLLGNAARAIEVNLDDPQSVKDAASTIAFGLMSYYTGNNTGDVPGNLPDPYFWWKAGAMFGTMVDYWFMTGDPSYNDATMQALLHQRGEQDDFMPNNQTLSLGNDDQGFWAMAAMSAAENNFPDPPDDMPQWLALVQAAFNQWVMRWDDRSCGGGLRWQIFVFNGGFDYKNSISNGCFFNLAARLARFTGNQTYADWAQRVWDWEVGVGLITDDFRVYDGVTVRDDNSDTCPEMDTNQWSYNAGIFLHGAAVMYNLTGDDVWLARTQGLLDEAERRFFNETVMSEQRCEPFGFCNLDQRSFKGYLARWMAGTAQVVPQMFDRIMALLRPNAEGAAAACSGDPAEGFPGIPGTACGLRWHPRGVFDGLVGVGEQMNALSAVMYTLLQPGRTAPVTAETGGSSRGNPGAGMEPHSWDMPAITTGDQVAAGFLTSGIALSLVACCIFMVK